MSGQLVGLVLWYGPDDLHMTMAMAVVAEDMRDENGSLVIDLPAYALRARMGETTLRRALRRCEEGGWLGVHRGGGQGKASRYWLNMAKLGVNPAGAAGNGYPQPSRSGRVTPSYPAGAALYPAGAAAHTVTRSDFPVNAHATPDQHLPGALVSVGMTDEERDSIRDVLAFMPSRGRPNLNATVRDSLLAALRAGRTVAGIKAWLDTPEADLNWSVAGPGAVVKALQRLAATPPPAPRRKPESEWKPTPGQEHLDDPAQVDTAAMVEQLRTAVRAAPPMGRNSVASRAFGRRAAP